MPDWEEDTDKLLLNVAIVGCAFRKTYFDHTVGAEPLRDGGGEAPGREPPHEEPDRRAPHHRGSAALRERHRGAHALGTLPRGRPQAAQKFGEDDDPTHDFLECHTWYDLDGDGYREPYICVVHKDSQTVVRVTARFEAAGMTSTTTGRS
jgi:chaperonin GroES